MPPAPAPRMAQMLGDLSPDASVLKGLKRQVVIGSAVDPDNGAQNPYGLSIAPVTDGTLTKGDLVICDFNAKSALLPNGNLVVGNTLDPDGKNIMIEISAAGKLLDVRNVDTGPAGALFGIVATGKSNADTKVYFNDDNDNDVQVLER